MPAQRKRRALKSAWVIRWKNAIRGVLRAILTIITPSWLRVERAMIFFMSHSVLALSPAISVVNTARIKRDGLKSGKEDRNG